MEEIIGCVSWLRQIKKGGKIKKNNEKYKYDPLVVELRGKIIEEAKKSKYIGVWFLQEHLMEVERLANLLCDKHPEADRDVVGLGVWFHDIGRLRDRDKNHDIYGAEEAKKVLLEKGYPKKKIERVYEVCRAHSYKDVRPESLEAKILATVDAMSHFFHNFYFRFFWFHRNEGSFGEVMDLVREKVERDFNDKIAFDEGRDEVRKEYEAMKLILQD